MNLHFNSSVTLPKSAEQQITVNGLTRLNVVVAFKPYSLLKGSCHTE